MSVLRAGKDAVLPLQPWLSTAAASKDSQSRASCRRAQKLQGPRKTQSNSFFPEACLALNLRRRSTVPAHVEGLVETEGLLASSTADGTIHFWNVADMVNDTINLESRSPSMDQLNHNVPLLHLSAASKQRNRNNLRQAGALPHIGTRGHICRLRGRNTHCYGVPFALIVLIRCSVGAGQGRRFSRAMSGRLPTLLYLEMAVMNRDTAGSQYFTAPHLHGIGFTTMRSRFYL